MKKEFLSYFCTQLIVFGLITALGSSHEPTVYLNENTVSSENKENNVSMVDNIQICYRTDDKDVLEESCITSKCIMVPYRFSIKDNTNWMKRVWLRTFPLMNWKDKFLDRAMFFALKPPSDIIHVPEFNGNVLLGNTKPMFKFTLQTYKKTLGDSVMFFVDSQNVDEITCINSKCFNKHGECKERICSCSCSYNMFNLTYYTERLCDMCTFGVEWRFMNIEKGSIFKQYLSRKYDSTGFGNLDSHIEILRGAYQDDKIDVSATEDSSFGQSKKDCLVISTVLMAIAILLLLYVMIQQYKRRGQIAARGKRYVSISKTVSKKNCKHTNQRKVRLLKQIDKDVIEDSHVLTVTLADNRDKQPLDHITKDEGKHTNQRKGRLLKQIDKDVNEDSHVLTVALADNRVKQPLDYITKEGMKTWIKLSKDIINDIKEEVKCIRGQEQFLHGVFKYQTPTRNNNMRDFDYETRDAYKDLMKKPEDVKPFNKFSHVKIKDIEVEVEDEKQLSPFTYSESAFWDRRQEKIRTSYKYDPLKHKYKQKGDPTKSFYSNSKYEHEIMAARYDTQCIDLKAKKLKEMIKSCRHEMEECERQLTQIVKNIKKLPTVINGLQFQEKALEIERILLSQQRENFETLLQKHASDLNPYRNTRYESLLKHNNKENES